jgi:uncharacterized repeat protein (TIGR01451 family)
MELLSRRKLLVAIGAGVAVAVCLGWCAWAADPAQKPASPDSPAETQEAGTLPTLELKIDGPAKAAVDDKVTFELLVTNVGKTPARGLLVIDHFGPGLEHVMGRSPIERPLADLAPGQSQRVGLTFRVTRSGRLAHTVQLTSGGKVVASARSSLSAVAATTEPVEAKPEQPAPSKPSAAEEQPETLSGVLPGVKPAPGSAFPEIKPKTKQEMDGERAEGEFPDLGPPLVENPNDLTRLHPKYPVWIDRKNKRVVVQGAVCSRECPLELFACLRTSKDYESVVAVPGKASLVHAGLLAAGAEPGSPVQFRPTYTPARGSEIEVTVVWKDEKGNRQTARAQDWVREVKTKKAMSHPWVFGGSRILKDQETGEKAYYADLTGELICVSNFPSAMLDLPIESTSSDAELVFEAFTERIPPRGTPVTLILTPKLKKERRTTPKPPPDDKGASPKGNAAAAR